MATTGETPTKRTPRIVYGIAALIVLVGFGLRVWELDRASLWVDEALTEIRMQGSLLDCWELLLDSGNQVPLYFSLLWVLPNDSVFWLRFTSVALGAIGIAVLMFAIVSLYKRYDWALLAGALLAVNPFHIWLSRMARPYPLAFILAVMVSYYFLELINRNRTRAIWTGFILTSMAAYLTHYYAIGLPLAQYILFAFILRGNRGFFRRWLGAQVIAGIPTLLWVFALSQREAVSFGIGWIPRPGLDDVPVTFWNMMVGYDGSLPWYIIPGLIAAFAGLLSGMIYAARARTTDRVNFYWFWLIVAPLMLGFVVSLFRPLYVDRYFIVFLPAVLILMIVGWSQLPRRSWIAAPALLVIMAGVANFAVIMDAGEDEKEDWRAAAEYVEAQRLPDDGLLMESPIELLAFRRYLDDEMDYGWLLGEDSLVDQYDPSITRLWAIYRNPQEDGHRQGILEPFDPFAPTESPMSDFVIERRDLILDVYEVNGVTVLLVNVDPAGVVIQSDTESNTPSGDED